MPVDPDKLQASGAEAGREETGDEIASAEAERNLADNPEGANETEVDYGRHSSTGYNGLDNDSTRRR